MQAPTINGVSRGHFANRVYMHHVGSLGKRGSEGNLETGTTLSQIEVLVPQSESLSDFPQQRKDGFILARRFLGQYLPGRLV